MYDVYVCVHVCVVHVCVCMYVSVLCVYVCIYISFLCLCVLGILTICMSVPLVCLILTEVRREH